MPGPSGQPGGHWPVQPRPGLPPRADRRGGRRRRRGLRVVVAAMAVIAVAAAVGGVWVYSKLSGNIQAMPLFGGLTGNAGTEKADAFGNTPVNLLVIGSDARGNAADCRLGGGCGHATSQAGTGANADVEMVVHLAADRSNATVMSIPRDTLADLPPCIDPVTHRNVPGYRGMINGALAHGPGCQVAAVHQLTGIPIDHFVMVDFAGVVTMADAVGGVSVCVSDNVYDTYSHLKLSRGTHTLTGQAALEFVRSRHAFGDGSDLGRTYAQHLYLASLTRTLKSAGTLANPGKVYSLADAATKALTVDTGLGSVPRLVALAADMDKVPTQRTTFTTMQTVPDPANMNRVVPGPGAQTLFDAITNDQPLTPAHPESSPSPTSPGASGTGSPPVPRAQIAVRVVNGGDVAGRAAGIAAALIADGFSPRTRAATGSRHAATTSLVYGPDQRGQAQAVAAALDLPVTRLRQGTASGLVLTIGVDWPGGTRYPGGPAPSPDAAGALAGSHAQTANQSGACAPVSHGRTVEVDHMIMTPARAYAYATARGVPDSDNAA
ncbi:MAG TPA: LCP family protein [Kineosporiaceae bacterium]